ncbi:uncharacterized protein LOC129306617 isoform X3 [Prosopis cineraria]|uniref:uncharacterized protein LOC129306617 isoform X3 n=1 Tax=Prosopis cineraria TaxID=364024 RepID=UPI00240EB715|nr:uncharacterized protein LOC129306617 isoform X3 [Prosopis cineraria]
MNSESTHAKAYASVVGAFTFSGKMNSKPNLAYAAWKQHRSRGNVMCALHEMTNPKKRLFFKDEPSGSEVEALKLYAMALSEEDPERAVEIMRNECEYWKERKAERYLLMALIELLLSQWKYQEAKEDIEKLMEHIEKKGWAFDLPPEKVYFLKEKYQEAKKITQNLMEDMAGVLPKKVYFLKAIAESATDIEKAAASWAEYHDALEETSPSDFPRPWRI